MEYIKYDQENQLQHDLFNHFDTNKDGLLQRTEYVDTNFSKMDHNGRCKVHAFFMELIVVLFAVWHFILLLWISGDGEVSRTDYDHYFTNVSKP